VKIAKRVPEGCGSVELVGGEEQDDGEHPAHVDERRVLDGHLVNRHYATARRSAISKIIKLKNNNCFILENNETII